MADVIEMSTQASGLFKRTTTPCGARTGGRGAWFDRRVWFEEAWQLANAS